MDDVLELSPRVWVQSGCWLIQEQQFRPTDDAYRDIEPTALTSRQFLDAHARMLGEADEIEQLLGVDWSNAVGGRVRLVIATEMGQQIPYPPPAVVTPGLQNDPDPSPPLLTSGCRINAEDADLSRRPNPEPFEDLNGRRLTDTIRTEECDHFSPADAEVDPIENVRLAVPHAQAANVDHKVAVAAHWPHLVLK
jgi:hypothetical protein